METTSPKRRQILETLEGKSLLKQRVYNKTFEVMQELKESLHEMSGELNDDITSSRLLRVDYRDRGKFEAQIQVAGDILIFAMPTNIFTFAADDKIHYNDHFNSSWENQYFGIINIYNFLSDSFKYNRNGDEGYLIGRVYINRHGHFYLDGIDSSYGYQSYGKEVITEEILVDIVESAIIHAMDFDLYVPPFKEVRSVLVEQMNTKAESSNIKIAKRLGLEF